MNRRHFFDSALAKFASFGAAQIALRQQLRDLDRSRFKVAALGGDQEAGFEQAFASLAYAYMREKAPQILDHMVGFQLLDRADDNRKAVGVFGFHLDPDTWLYAPVFFLNGDLKGHELLYVQNKDAFVPLNEEWVNYILSRQPHILGNPSAENISVLGGLQPTIYPLKVPPRYAKYGSVHDQTPRMAEWAQRFLPFLGAAAMQTEKFRTKHAGLSQHLDLGHTLSQHLNLLQGAWRLTQEYPAIKLGFDRFYGPDFFQKTATAMLGAERARHLELVLSPPGTAPSRPSAPKVAAVWDPVEDPRQAGTLQLLKLADFKLHLNPESLITENLPELSDEDREKLMRDSVLIRDLRDPQSVTLAYNTQIPMSLNNPTDSGVYPVLVEEGKFDKCLVLSAPMSADGNEPFLTVVRLEGNDGGRAHMNSDVAYIWAKPPDMDEEFRKWWKGLDSASLEDGGRYVAVGERGNGTVPFMVNHKNEDNVYSVHFDDCADNRRPGYMPRLVGHSHNYGYDGPTYHSGEVLKINQRPGTSLRPLSGELFVPKEFKFIKLRRPRRDAESYDEYEKDNPLPIRLGNLMDQQMRLFQKMATLKASLDGPDVILNFGHKPAPQRISKVAALFELVGEHGLKEASAREILSQLIPGKTYECKLRYAPFYAEKQGYHPLGGYLRDVGQMAPMQPPEQRSTESYITTGAQGQYPYEETVPVPALDSSLTDPSVYDPYRAHYPGPLEVAQRATQEGQKEVFDTSVLSSLLKTVSGDRLFSEGIGDLIKAIDRLGRLRFSMLWHREEAEERYGQDALPDIEDALVNAFEALGQVTLELKEKEVNPQIDLPSTRESLSAISEN